MTNEFKSSDSQWVEDHYLLLRKFLRQKYKFYEDIEYKEKVLRDFNLSHLTKTILQDFQKTNEQKLKELGKRLFSNPKVIILNGDVGEGKGTTTASIFIYYKDYIKKILKKKIVALMPCPQLPFIDKYYWSINDVPKHCIIYSPELGIHFPNTDYQSQEAKGVNPIMIKIRQDDNIIFGETQTDSIVHIGFYKFLSVEIFRYQNPRNASFKREKLTNSDEINIYNELLKMMLPPSSKTLNGEPILENLTKIILFDDLGFMSVHIPRTSDYTQEMSIGFRKQNEMLEQYILDQIKQNVPIPKILEYLAKKYQYTRTPLQWKLFFQSHNLEFKESEFNKQFI